MTEILSCVTCKHYKDAGDLFLYCKRYPYEIVNYVTGEVYEKLPLCVYERGSEGECGPEGKGWEQAEQIPPKQKRKFSFREFLKLINF